ncbi:hypothetical protein NCCP2140_08450 [Pseudoalteromonas sp. NCCP-2140]|nr:hypothetical protein NCCP2140_08450 [Pseudoalteromonas sp. NCCP-2140]
MVGTKPTITNSVVPMANALRVNASNAIGITYPLFNFESAAIVAKIKFAKNSSSDKILLSKMKR